MDLKKRGWEGVDYVHLRVQVFWNATPCHLVPLRSRVTSARRNNQPATQPHIPNELNLHEHRFEGRNAPAEGRGRGGLLYSRASKFHKIRGISWLLRSRRPANFIRNEVNYAKILPQVGWSPSPDVNLHPQTRSSGN